ncbi:MAG TPA: GNAT family protein [bacterium]|nr:GNAT family protein [bacterium]
MFAAPIREGLELRLYEERFAPQLLAAVDANRDHLMEWLPWPPLHTTLEHSLDFIRRSRQQYADGKSINCGIWERGQLVGGLGTHDIDTMNQSVSIGYWLAKDAEGRGIMTAACRVLLDHLFDGLGLHRVWLEAAEGNTKSRRVAERLGFRQEGKRIQSHRVGDRWLDMVQYGILVEEWRTHRPSLVGRR